MPKKNTTSPSTRGRRYVDLAITVALADVEQLEDGSKRWVPGSDQQLLRVGGVWDAKRKRWARDRKAATRTIIRFHRGQEDAARWLCDWLGRWARGDWAGVRRVWSAMLLGGRRSGKTHLAMATLLIFAVLKRGALVWAVSPTLDTGAELDQALASLLPVGWATRYEATTGRSVTYVFANGSRIVLRSGGKPERLKAGRVDLCLYNEAQMQSQSGYIKLRGAIADRGGLVILAANPPDEPRGLWVEEHYHRATTNEIDAVAFAVDPRRNPWIEYEALASLKGEVDEKTFNREVLGLFEPIGNVCLHAYRAGEHHVDPQPHLRDITAEVTRRHFGRAFDFIVGMDFQQTPVMAAVVFKLFADEADPAGFLAWIVDEVMPEKADENDLLDALEDTARWVHGGPRDDDDTYDGKRCVVVMDASAWWQDGAHNLGKTSDKALRARGWVHLHKPQRDSDRNPEIKERVKATNAALKTTDGRRRLFVARHCRTVAEAFQKWEIRNGLPSRRSSYAHPCDAASYVEYRLRGRPKPKGAGGGYKSVSRYTRADEMRGF